MTSLLVLIPAALMIGLLGLAAFLWAMRNGQFEDLDGAAHRILFDGDGDPDSAWRTRRPPLRRHDLSFPQELQESDHGKRA
ncbi:MAG TPA: cbb3-type cytochrome oxidase assembly protein CcoS [Alphaproteobacteria bacterium]